MQLRLSSALLLPLLLASLTALSSCAASRDRADADTLAALQASQSEPYGVPATDDVTFTVGATMGAVIWGRLDDASLLDWERTWRALCTAADRPCKEYERHGPDGTLRRANLFEQSPKDGFCVTFALDTSDALDNQVARAALKRMVPRDSDG